MMACTRRSASSLAGWKTVVRLLARGAAAALELRGSHRLDANAAQNLVAYVQSQRDASFALIEQALLGHFDLVASPALWLEYESVLKRKNIVALHGLASSDIDDILNALAAVVHPVQSHYLWHPQLRDPNDEMVLEAAVNGQASCLVTLNTRDFIPAAEQWQIDLRLPGKFLQLLENPS